MRAADFLDAAPSADAFLSGQRNARVDEAGALFEEQGGGNPLVRLGRGFKAIDVLGRFAGNKLGLVSDESLRSAAEDYNVGADPRLERVTNTINDADGFGATAAALWQALKRDPGAVAGLALEQVPTMAASLPVGGALGQVVGGLAGRLGANAAVRSAATGAGVVSANTGVQSFPSAFAEGLQHSGGDIAAAQQFAAKKAAAEAGVAALFGPLAAKTVGGRVGNTLFQGARGGVSEMAETLGGNTAVGQDTSKGELLLSGVLGSVMDLPEAAVARRAAANMPYTGAQALASAINGFDGGLPATAPIDAAIRQPGAVRFDPAGLAEAIREPRPAPPEAPHAPAIPQLGFDPAVQNPQPVMAVDRAGTAQPMSAADFLEADTSRQEAVDTGLTPDVQRAQSKRGTPDAPAAVPSDLVERLRAAGWTPPANQPTNQPDNAPNPDPEDVQAIGQDFERLYQGDVKQGIKERLGIAQPAAAEPEAAKPASYAQSPFLREIAGRGGVNIQQRGDTNVDANRQTKRGRVMPNPYNIDSKPLFRPDGLRGDALVESLVSQGYLTQKQVDEAEAGGVGGADELAYDMIRRELVQPGSVKPIDMRGEQAANDTQQQVSQELQQKADAIGFDTKGLDDQRVNDALNRIERRRARAQGRMDVSRESKAEREAMRDADDFADLDDDALDAAWEGGNNVSTEYAMRSLGFTEQEIADAIAEESRDQSQGGQGDGASRQDEPGRSPVPPAANPGSAPGPDSQEGLTSYTPEELRARDERIADQTRTEARQQAEAEAQSKAERDQREIQSRQDASAENFELGQDAQDSLSGQRGMFSQPKTRAAPDRPADLIALRKRMSVLKSLRACLS